MPITGFRPLPLNVAAAAAPSFAPQPLSVPIRIRSLATAVVVASGVFYTPFVAAPPETITVDKWHQAFSEPQRSRAGLPTREQQFVAYVGAAPFTETVSADRWTQPLSVPVRLPPRLATGSQQSVAYIGAAPFAESVTADKWAQPASQPTYAKRRIQPDAAIIAFAEGVTVDRWLQPLAEPQRQRLGLPVREQQSVAYIGASPFPEAVGVDRWLLPLAQPTYAKPRIQPDAVSYGLGEVVAPDKWYVALTEPQRFRRGLPAFEQQSSAYIGASPFPETVSADRWVQPLSNPTLAKRKVQPDGVSYSYFVAPSSEVVTVDKWFIELSGPVRQRIGLAVFEQQAVAFVKAAPFAESITADRWVQPFTEPVRFRLGLPTREQQSVVYIGAAPFPETVSADRFVQPLSQPTYAKPRTQPEGAVIAFTEGVTPDRWAQPLSVPYFGRRLLTAEQQSVAYVGFSPFAEKISADRWAYQTSQPTYATRRVQPDGVVNSAYVVPSSEVITTDKWYAALSEPQRSRAGLSAFEQQSTAYIGASPFIETVSADRWLQPTSQPTRAIPQPAFGAFVYGYFPEITVPVVVTEPDPGGRIVGGHFSRKKWRELKEAEYAQQQAAERANELTRTKVRQAAQAATELAERAIAAAQLTTANIEVARLTRSLNALSGAVALSETMKAANRTAQVATAILQQIADQEDEDDIEMLILGL